MKDELSCAVAQSLMPLSVDEATDKETEAALQTHLKTCADCRAIYESMKDDAEAMPLRTDAGALFKKARRKLRLRILLTVLICCAAAAGIWVFSMWNDSDSILKVNDYDVWVEKVPVSDFLLVDAGGGDMMAHLKHEPNTDETQFHDLFLLKAEDYQKLKERGYAYYVSFDSIGRKQIDDVSDCCVKDGKLQVLLWSYHDNSLFGGKRERNTDALIYDDFSDVVNTVDGKTQTQVTWVLEKVEPIPGPG